MGTEREQYWREGRPCAQVMAECPDCYKLLGCPGEAHWCLRPVACPNPQCSDGNVPGGAKGDLLCPECLKAGRVKPKPVTMIGGPKP